MILRPVTPQSAEGRPAGSSRRVHGHSLRLHHPGPQRARTSVPATQARIVSGLAPAACWVETSTRATRSASRPGTPPNLRLPVGAEPRHFLRLPRRGEARREPVRQEDGQRHQLRRLVGRVAEHHPWSPAPAPRLPHRLVDLLRLPREQVQHLDSVGVERLPTVRVPDLAQGLARHRFGAHTRARVISPASTRCPPLASTSHATWPRGPGRCGRRGSSPRRSRRPCRGGPRRPTPR